MPNTTPTMPSPSSQEKAPIAGPNGSANGNGSRPGPSPLPTGASKLVSRFGDDKPAPFPTATPRNGPSGSLPDSTIIKWLRDMVLIREFENRCAQSYQQAKIGGFCHLYIGQEASAVGTIAAVNPDDPVVLAYRDHGHALARGMSARACMAEMFGKLAGCAKGKGGSMHMFDKPHWLFGGHGIVGAQTPLGAGLAFAHKYELEVLKRGVNGGEAKKKVSLCYLGDGALNQGSLHEAMNLAGLWSLPVIYIIENNRYSMGTAIERGTTMAHDLAAKARAYGIEALEISDRTAHAYPGGEMNLLAVYDLFKPFADNCRDKQVPGWVDLQTYRYQGHSMSDPQKYRNKDEVEGIRSRDSIELLSIHLTRERKVLTEAKLQAIIDECKAIATDAVEFAEKAEPPPPDELYSDVYLNAQPGLSPTADYKPGIKNPLL